MSTQPTVPNPKNIPGQLLALVNVQTGKFNKAILWASHYIKTHEIFLGVILAAALVWGVSGKVQDVITAHDKRAYDVAQSARDQQTKANADLAVQNANLAAQYKGMAQQALDQNAKLEQSNAKLTDALAKQKSVDATLPPTNLAARIETLANLPSGTILPAPGNVFSVSNDGAVGIAQTLEAVPVLQEQLVNTRQEKLAVDQLLAVQTTRVDTLNNTVAGKDKELAAADKAHKDEIKLVKDNAAKGKRKIFVLGYIAGLATRGALKIFGGV